MKETVKKGKYKGSTIRERRGKTGKTYYAKKRITETDSLGNTKSRVITVSGKTIDEVKAKLAGIVENQSSITNGKITVKAAWAEYVEDRKSVAQSNTLIDYAAKYRTSICMLENKKISEINDETIIAYIDSLKGKGYTIHTIDDHLSVLFAFLKYCKAKKYISREFAKSEYRYIYTTGRAEQREIHVYSEKEFGVFIQYVKAAKGNGTSERAKSLYIVLYSLMFYTGLRISEALGLRWCDIRTTGPGEYELEVCQKRERYVTDDGKYKERSTAVLKSAAAHRIIPISEKLFDMINAIRPLNVDETCAILSEVKLMSMTNIHSAITKRLKADGKPTITCHEFRKSCLTRWAEAGMDPYTLKTLAGHASISVTNKYYLKTDRKKSADKARKFI